MKNRVMHLDMDAFFASVEQVKNPRLKGRPVIVGAGVIASCSYEARRFGLRAGMALRQAKRLCPRAIILAGDSQVYRAFAEKVWDICRTFTPDMETLLDDAYLDLSGTERLHGDARPMAQRLKAGIKEATGLTVTIGLATGRTVARIASASVKPDGIAVVRPGCEMDFIGRLPIEDLPGVGPATAEVLRKLNIETIGALSRLPSWSLEALFGATGTILHERSCGRDTRALSRREMPTSISRETSFHKDTTDSDEVEATLHYLAERAMRTLRGLGLLTRTVKVKIRYSDFSGDACSKSLSRFTDLDSEVFTVARGMLARLWRRRVSLHGVGIALSRFAFSDGEQANLFDGEYRRRLARLYRAVDEVRDRYGYGAIIAGRSLELLEKLPRSDNGFILRTSSLTK